MKIDQSAFLNHILDAIKKIEKYTQGIDEELLKGTIWFKMVLFGFRNKMMFEAPIYL